MESELARKVKIKALSFWRFWEKIVAENVFGDFVVPFL